MSHASHRPPPSRKSSPIPLLSPAERQQAEQCLGRVRSGVTCGLLCGLDEEEISAHAEGMPADYWNRVQDSDLIEHLLTIHGFLETNSAVEDPVQEGPVHCRLSPLADGARLVFSTWDRRGLLAMIASALSTTGLSIRRVEAFTRADNIVLDSFDVAEADGSPSLSEARLKELGFLINGMMSQPPRFASVWARLRHRVIDPPGKTPPRISFQPDALSEWSIIMTVEAPDRLGLLQDILQAVSNLGWNVRHALVETNNGLAMDRFHLQAPESAPVPDVASLRTLETGLRAVLTAKD